MDGVITLRDARFHFRPVMRDSGAGRFLRNLPAARGSRRTTFPELAPVPRRRAATEV